MSLAPECDHVERVEPDDSVDGKGIAAVTVAKRPVGAQTVIYPTHVPAEQAVL